MTIFDKAKELSLKATLDRIDKVNDRQSLDQSEPSVTKFAGHDPQTGNALIESIGCELANTATGQVITNTGIGKGEIVMGRATHGHTRLDKRPIMTNRYSCGSSSFPLSRSDSLGGSALDAPQDDELDRPQDGDKVLGSERCEGFALVYEEYTGEILEDGSFETRERRIPNSLDCKNPRNPTRPINDGDDGCVKPGEKEAGALKSCQWFPVSADDATNFTGCPTGMFNSGFVEFPAGNFQALCCTESGEPSSEDGIGRDWSPENATESGAAAESTNYCSDSYRAELIWDQGSVTTSSPPIQYTLTLGTGYYRVVHSAYGGTQIRTRFALSQSGAFSVSPNGCTTSDPVLLSGCQFCQDSFGLGVNYLVTDGGIARDKDGTAQVLNCNNDIGSIIETELLETLSEDLWVLVVSDSTGAIQTTEYNSEPTGFKYVCRTNTKVC